MPVIVNDEDVLIISSAEDVQTGDGAVTFFGQGFLELAPIVESAAAVSFGGAGFLFILAAAGVGACRIVARLDSREIRPRLDNLQLVAQLSSLEIRPKV